MAKADHGRSRNYQLVVIWRKVVGVKNALCFPQKNRKGPPPTVLGGDRGAGLAGRHPGDAIDWGERWRLGGDPG